MTDTTAAPAPESPTTPPISSTAAPTASSQPERKLCIHWGFLVIMGVLLAVVTYLSLQLLQPTSFPKEPSESIPTITPTINLTPTPTPIALHTGKGEYTVSHPKSTGPTIFKVIFDPLDVQKDETITLSVLLLTDSAIKSVTGMLDMDTKQAELNFTKTGTQANFQVFSTQLSVPDTVWYTYVVTITAINTNGSTSVTVAPRS